MGKKGSGTTRLIVSLGFFRSSWLSDRGASIFNTTITSQHHIDLHDDWSRHCDVDIVEGVRTERTALVPEPPPQGRALVFDACPGRWSSRRSPRYNSISPWCPSLEYPGAGRPRVVESSSRRLLHVDFCPVIDSRGFTGWLDHGFHLMSERKRICGPKA